MKSVLGKLGGLLAQEYTLIRGVRGDIQYITDELSSMQAFLRDLSTAPDGQDNRMKDWMKQIRDIAYDCEDCIDDFAHRLPDDSITDVRCSFIARRISELWTWWPRREIASNIANLKVRAQQIAERRSRYGVNNPSNGNSGTSGARAATYDIAEHQLASRQLIGMKEPVGMMTDMENLEKRVNKLDGERAVLSIVGFGGVGKTTIATALYRKVSNIFDCRASVTVSQNYDQDAVLRSILNQVMPQDRGHEQHCGGTESLEDKKLAAQIRSTLKRAVSLTKVNSQRINDRSLDTKQIKPETMDHDQLVEELKRRLAEKRGEVCKSQFPTVDRLTLDGVTRILDCCYNDLPGDLKTCSLYLSIFPKGWKISRKRLTRRWIAEGFVSEKQGLTEEEVAETYFNQLMRRKIIRPVEHCSNGKVKTFQVHDMVLEYIVSKSSEENFITVVGSHWMMPAPSNKVRRLSMQSNGSKHGNSTKGINLSQVRSLTVFGSLNQLPFHSFNNGIIQVLDLEGWKGLKEKHLKDICKMLVLKYLSLRQTEIAKIPSDIEKLEYLETLDIRETNVWELPRSVVQLKRISGILGGNKNPRKGLRLPQEKGKDPRKSMLPQEKSKDGMKALRILSGIEIVGESTAVAGLHQLTGLRKLSIYKLSIQKDGDTFKELRSSIEYLCSCGLQTLAINDENSDFINSLDSLSAPPIYLIALELSGKFERPPPWITKLHTLNKLTLSVTVLRTDSLELLCTLSSLFSLTFSLSATRQDKDIEDILEKNKSQSDGEIFVPFGFRSLKLLRFFAPLVPKLGFSNNAMPELEIIEMRFEAFEGLLGIDTLEKLQEVHLRVNDQTDEITKLMVDDLKNNTNGLKVIVDHIVTA
ncbi:unnamed protein product [Urochloa decumbens]|uniref:Uncharacterized protein n=1 Tax=Urochloa decumbens TaxID=240449 RepID=A0ABC9B625_9POAL